jgi:hypothetical protein
MKPYNSLKNSTKRIIRIPLYDIGTIAAGFYIGYAEGKGLDVSQNLEYLTKYGPTAFAVIYTPIMLKGINWFHKWMNNKMLTSIENAELEVHIKSGSKKYKDLDNTQKEEIYAKVINTSRNLESKIENQKYLRPTLIVGTRTAIETVIGYAAGRVYSQIN